MKDDTKDKASSKIIESMSDALLVLDFHGHVIRTNPAALNLFALDARDIRNKTYIQIFMDRPENDDFTDIIVDGVQNRETRLYREVPFLKNDGTRLDLAVTTSFLRCDAGGGDMEGIVLVVKDITEAKALERARNRVLDHLSHELRTPLSIVMASMAFLEPTEKQVVVQRIMRNLGRIEAIQMEVDDIVRKSKIAEHPRFSTWVGQLLDLLDVAAEGNRDTRETVSALKARIDGFFKIATSDKTRVNPWDRIPQIIEAAKALGAHRRVNIKDVLAPPFEILINGDLLGKCAMALLKNAVENTPDGGDVTLLLRNMEGNVELRVQDTGVGITAESQKQIFGGFYHAKDTDFYTTKKPFDFGAGGKGLDLLRLRIFSETYGFRLACESRRCTFIPKETDVCPGDVTRCAHIREASQCALSGGSTFTVLFPPDR